MTARKILVIGILSLGFVLFTPSTANAATFTVEMKNRAFSSQSLTISPGDTVTWINKDDMIHTATSDSQSGAETWDSGVLQQGQSYSKSFTVPGTYSYTCLPHPDMIATIQVKAPTPTPTPITPTAVPTAIPTQIIAPTTPLSSPATSQPTIVSLTLFLNGIGKSGDSLNKGAAGNLNPNRIARPFILSVYDLQNTLITKNEAMLMYSAETGNFTGVATIEGLSAEKYTLTIKTNGFVEQKISDQAITPGQTVTLPSLSLITGDINNDDQLNALDYNLLVNCFETKATTSSCKDALSADVNDDGKINGFDYNLFLRELSAQSRI